MLGAGLGWLSYRLYTEISVQDWHWNPRGTFSQGDRGYWTSDASANDPLIQDSYQYALPHRGFTTDQGDSASTRGSTTATSRTYWKSNPYLTSAFTHESDALHPAMVVVDLGADAACRSPANGGRNLRDALLDRRTGSGPDPINDPGNGIWKAFPADGSAVDGALRSRFDDAFVGTCDTHGASDTRNCVGLRRRRDRLGTRSRRGSSMGRARPGPHQSATYVSSVDPWHACERSKCDQEQPGPRPDRAQRADARDRRYVPVAISTARRKTPSRKSVTRARHYPIRMLELGEEPDGQYVRRRTTRRSTFNGRARCTRSTQHFGLGGRYSSGTERRRASRGRMRAGTCRG